MPPRRRTDREEGRAALSDWVLDAANLPRARLATAVRFTLEEFAARAPGGATELRVPPFGVVQCVPGPRHTRGTPPNVVELDAATWLGLVTGRRAWDEELAAGRIHASGERSDLSALLPLSGLVPEGQGPVGA